MSSGREEVDAAVHSAIRYSPLAVHIQLFSQIFLILLVDIFHYGLPAGEKRSRVVSELLEIIRAKLTLSQITLIGNKFNVRAKINIKNYIVRNYIF